MTTTPRRWMHRPLSNVIRTLCHKRVSPLRHCDLSLFRARKKESERERKSEREGKENEKKTRAVRE